MKDVEREVGERVLKGGNFINFAHVNRMEANLLFFKEQFLFYFFI